MRSTTILIGLLAILDLAKAGEDLSPTGRGDSLVLGPTDNKSSGTETKTGRRSRRLVVNDQECTLYEAAIEYDSSIWYGDSNLTESGSDDFSGDDDDAWHCLFNKTYSRDVLGLEDPLVRITGWSPKETESIYDEDSSLRFEPDSYSAGKVESGKSTMKFGRGIIDPYAQTMYVDSDLAQVVTNTNSRDGRELSSKVTAKVGKKNVLVVRVSTWRNKRKPLIMGPTIKKYVYDNPVSLKQQYKKCSYNKLKLLPFMGTTETNLVITDGISNIQLSKAHSDEIEEILEDDPVDPLRKPWIMDRVNAMIRSASEAKFGDIESQFDHVLFVLPEGLTGYYAIAIVGRWDSYYTEKWIMRPSFPLHEVGHNLGLDHAAEIEEYDDRVGYMGYSYNETKGPAMCFNPANNWYLGWYQDQSASYNGLESGIGKSFTLNGVADYNPATAGTGEKRRLVILQLTQPNRNWHYYIGYNRQKGINEGTVEDGDKILIVRKNGPPDQITTTKKVATLENIGDYHEIKRYNNQESVYIFFERKKSMGKDIVIRVSTVRPTPFPTQPPTAAPTRIPTPNPTPAPTERPTEKPTSAEPTGSPTHTPTAFGEIVDRWDLAYKGYRNRDCKWVAFRKKQRCALRSKKKLVKVYWCPKTCQNVNINVCYPDKVLSYLNSPQRNCDWVAEDLSKRCPKMWRKKKISDHWCPTTCNPNCNSSNALPETNIVRMRRRQPNRI